jgi:hypothetical protein
MHVGLWSKDFVCRTHTYVHVCVFIILSKTTREQILRKIPFNWTEQCLRQFQILEWYEPGLPDFSEYIQPTKTLINIPNNHKVYLWLQNISNGLKIDQMILKYTNIFHRKPPPKIYPSLDFWFEDMPSGNPGVSVTATVIGKTGQLHNTRRNDWKRWKKCLDKIGRSQIWLELSGSVFRNL